MSDALSRTNAALSLRTRDSAGRSRWVNRLTSGAIVLLVALLALPMCALLWTLFADASPAWPHLRATVLPEYLTNSLLLVVLVGAASLIIGTGCAWLTSTMKFPGVRVLSAGLVLPLAAPAYVVAYVYTDLLDYSGPVQSAFRSLFDLLGVQAGNYWFPEIRSLPGAALMLTLVLYPYVYLLARAAFVRQSSALFDAARVLGQGPWRAFFSVALPTARPAIVGGTALVLMETLADFGVVEYFGVATFTTGIFRTWYAMGDQLAALQLAAWLFLVVLVLVMVEFFARRGRVANPVGHLPEPRLVQLKGVRALLATFACAVPVMLGFVLPVCLLVQHHLAVGDPLIGRSFIDFVVNSFFVAGCAAIIATGCAVLLGYSQRERGTLLGQLAVRVAALGYALPGAVLGLALLVPLSAADRWFAGFARDQLGLATGLLMTGTVAALVFAYVIRFMTAAYNALDAGLTQVSPQIDAVGRSLGASPGRLLKELHLPLVMPAVLTAALLVFIDVLKELPATLILRPFNFETLATRAYRLASDERIAEASTASLLIVLLGLLPTLLVLRQTRQKER